MTIATINLTEDEKIIQDTIDNEPRYYWDAEYRLLMDRAEMDQVGRM